MKELENEKQAINYLLGAMSEQQRDAFEERLFLDENLSFTVTAAEKDLIDEYLRGELSFEERIKFETNFLITDSRREKLNVASILDRKLLTEKEIIAVSAPTLWERIRGFFAVQNLALAGATATVILFLILAGIWLVRRDNNQQVAGGSNQNPPIENPEIPAPSISNTVGNSNIDGNTIISIPQSASNKSINSNEKPHSSTNRQKEVKPKPAPSPEKEISAPVANSFFAFTLFPAIRSGENQELIITPEVEAINLRVVHSNEEKFIRYRAELRNSDGEVVWSREISANIKGKSKSLNFTLSSQIFKSDLYELTLLGITPSGEYEETNFYNFTVKKK